MSLSRGYFNLRIIALILAVISGITYIDNTFFYGRNLEMLSDSSAVTAPAEREDGSGIYFTIENRNEKLNCSLSYCGEEGWRLQSAYKGEISDYGASQLLSYYMDEENTCSTVKARSVISSDSAVVTAGDGSTATVDFSPFRITYKDPSGKISAQITNLETSGGNTVVRGKLERNEAMWGGGEHFDYVNQRGQHVEINAVDKWAETKGNSYMPIPILISSRGSGLFMNRFEKMTIDVDSRIVPKNTWQFCVLGAPCDLFVYTSEKPADVLYGYSLLTGFSPEPAEWTYGSVICRYSPDFATVEGVLDMARNMEENDFPWEAVITEGFDAANREKLREMSDAVHKMGKKLMTYSTTGENHFWRGTDETQFMVRRASDGSINLIPANSENPEDNPNVSYRKYFDITSENARTYLYDQIWHSAIHDYNVNGSKVDFCELFPDEYELILADGKTSGAHHWYPVVFNSLLYRKLSENPEGAMTINRGGGIGAQRYPWIWLGDQKREFRYLKAQVKGMLSSGISGVPFITFDMGGYKNAGDDEAYVFRRAVEFTAFTGNIQTHGTVKRAYDFDDETKDIYRKFAKIHDALRPYLIEQGKVSCQTGQPLVRHLALEFWNDSKVWNIEDEYMLGEKLLIAPVLDDGYSRNIYLPEGSWTDLWTGKQYTGGKTLYMYKVATDEVPVFVRADVQSAAFDQCRDSIVELYTK